MSRRERLSVPASVDFAGLGHRTRDEGAVRSVLHQMHGRCSPCFGPGLTDVPVCRSRRLAADRHAVLLRQPDRSVYPRPTNGGGVAEAWLSVEGRRRIAVGLGVVALIGVLAVGMHRQFVLNADIDDTDQSAYVGYAQSLREHPDRPVNDRARMPLFPYLMSTTVSAGASAEDTFLRGKLIGVAIGVALLGGAWVILRRSLGVLAATATTTVLAFGLVVYKAPWAQTELLYYSLFALSLWLMFRLLRHPDITTAAVTGLVAGLAHLSKPGAIPLIALFAVAAVACMVVGADRSARHRVLVAGTIASVAFVFALTILPYSSNNQDIFGSFLYNSNSAYYLWYDSWPEILAGTNAYGDQFGPPALPAAEIPSMRTYVDTHSWFEIAGRIVGGVGTQLPILFAWPVTWILVLQITVAGIAVWSCRARVAGALRREPVPFLFVGAVIVVYFLLSAWWMPITPAARFAMVLALPALTGSAWVIQSLWRERMVHVVGREMSASHLYFGALLFVSVAVVVPVSVMLSGSMPGGR